MCGSQTDKCLLNWSQDVWLVVVVVLLVWWYVATDASICSCGVLLSFVSFPQIQPSEGAAAQTPLAANTGVLARPGAQAGVGVGDRDGDRDGCTRGHGAGGHSCARAPCVRLTLVTVSESMLRSSSSGMHCSHWNRTNNSTQATFIPPVLLRHSFPSILQLSVC